jgi:predicted nuclease with TOPRIM domain
MNDAPQKIDEAIWSEIKLLQSKFQEHTIKLGNLQVEKMEADEFHARLEEREKQLREEWLSLRKLDRSLLDKIIQKYGEGGINMADGTFVPTAMVTDEQRKV